MEDTTFTVTLRRDDWNSHIGGWRCEALSIPGAEVSAFYVDGKKQDDAQYRRERNVVRWTTHPPPPTALLQIALTRDLGAQEATISNLEADRLRLEREKLRIEHHSKWITAVATVIAAAVGALGAYAAKLPAVEASSDEPVLTDYSEQLRACQTGLRRTATQVRSRNLNAESFVLFVQNQTLPHCEELVDKLVALAQAPNQKNANAP